MRPDFYLHEDEWGMIALELRENAAERGALVVHTKAHGEVYRAPDGVGWTQIAVAPEAPMKLATRGIKLAAVAGILGPAWKRFERVLSGYGSAMTECTGAYAFGTDAHRSVIYGSHDSELVTSLHVSRRDPQMADVLHRLGMTFELIICDLWIDQVIDLADERAIARYVADDD